MSERVGAEVLVLVQPAGRAALGRNNPDGDVAVAGGPVLCAVLDRIGCRRIV